MLHLCWWVVHRRDGVFHEQGIALVPGGIGDDQRQLGDEVLEVMHHV